MALIGSPGSFKKQIRSHSETCWECHRPRPPGHEWVVSNGKGGRIVKWVCSEECRETFNDRFWQERADTRQAKRPTLVTTP